jgi:hypothetical protein
MGMSMLNSYELYMNSTRIMPSPQPLINQYQDHLTRAGKSPYTVRAYIQDATAFGRWFEGINA